MATREEDRELATRVVRGEAGAAEALFDRVFEPLYRQVCARLGGDHHAAQDIVSISLLAGLRALSGFRGEATLTSWFFTIASRKTVDLKRRRAVRLVAGGNGELEALVGPADSRQTSSLDRLADAETRLLVQEALGSLPDRHQDVLRWKYFDDSSLAQVARRLQLSPKAAERRLARARVALAAALRRRGLSA